MIRQRFFLLMLCVLASMPQGAKAQASPQQVQQGLEALKASVGRSRAALSLYKWTEHTDILVKKDVKNSFDNSCKYDLEGKVVKTPVGEAEVPKNPRGKLAKKKKLEMTDYMQRAVTLIHTYMPPDPERLDAGVKAGTATMGPAGAGKGQMTFRNYFRDADTFTVIFDETSKDVLRLDVKTYLEDPKDVVTLEVAFAKLPDGTNHVASSVLNAPEKKIQVKVSNLNYTRLAR